MPTKPTIQNAHYSRLQLAKKLTDMGYPVSDQTIYRWERTGKITRPKKLAHNGYLLYTDINVTAILKFMERTR